MEAAAKEGINSPGNKNLCTGLNLSSSKLSHPPVRFRIKMPSTCSTPLVSSSTVNVNDGSCCGSICEAELSLESERVSADNGEKTAGEEFVLCTTNCNGATLEDYEGYQGTDIELGILKKESSGDNLSSQPGSTQERWLVTSPAAKNITQDGELLEQTEEIFGHLNDTEVQGNELSTVAVVEVRSNTSGSWKKNRSARKDGGARRWENASCEVLQPASGNFNSSVFTPGVLVWGKLVDRPWWPAEVVKTEEIPPSIIKQKRSDSIPVKFLAVQESEGSQSLALLEPGSVVSYAEHKEEFSQQNVSTSEDAGIFVAALVEAKERFDKQTVDVKRSSSARNKKMEVIDRTSSLRQGGERSRLDFRAKLRGKQDSGKGDLKSLKDREVTMTRKRKREGSESRNRKRTTSLPGLGEPSADAPAHSFSKKRKLAAAHRERGSDKESGAKNDVMGHDSVLQEKTTGDDGYFFECVVCDIGGNLLCCDNCPRTYHLECLDPPLKRTPPGKWHCPACREQMLAAKAPVRVTSELKRSRASRRSEEVQPVVGQGKESSKRQRKRERTARPVIVPQMPEKKEKSRKRESKKTKTEEKVIDRVQAASKCSRCGTDVQTLKASVKNPSLCKQCCKLGSKETGNNQAKKEPEKGTASDKQEKEDTILCETCGAGGCVVFCDTCHKAFHKDCALPHSKKTLKEPWTCTKCEEENCKQKEEVHLANASSASMEVDRIFGCRVGCATELLCKKDERIFEEGMSQTKSCREDSHESTKVPAETKECLSLPNCAESSSKLQNGLQQERNNVSRNKRKRRSSQMENENLVDTCEHECPPAVCTEATVSTMVSSDLDEVLSNGDTKGRLEQENILESVKEEEGAMDPKNDNSAPFDAQDDKPEMEYLVKWAGRSHVHNEWVNESRLRLLSKRKLDNYKFKYGTFPIVLVDEKWSQPQRVLARRIGQGGVEEVLVKWCGLPYDESTWERVDEPVIGKNQELIKSFDHFESAAQKWGSSLSETSGVRRLDSRSAEIETLTEQPKELKGGSLFPHQMEALNWLRKCWNRKRNVILADEMGLGKTISASAFISSLYQEFKVKAPCLVLVPLSTMPNWFAEFSAWTPSLNVIEYHGSAKARATIRQHEWYAAGSASINKSQRAYKFNVMLTTYEMVIADASQLRAVPWEVLIVDEGHRLKNSGSKLFHLLNTFSFSHRVLLTGTPLQNNVGEMYNLLNFLQPEAFPSLAAFEEKFNSLSTAEQVEELKKLVAPHMLRRLKKDAMQNIPPKTERVVPVELSSVQSEYYRALLTRNYQVLRQAGKTAQHQSMLNIVMQLRKVCNHPYLIPGTEPEAGSAEFLHEMRIKASAKLTLLHAMLKSLREQGHRVLIFSQMTKLLDILEDYLTVEFGNQTYERVDGSISVAERQAAIARFNQDTSRFVFLLSTRACGLGINLATADTVVIYDSDFNPHADIQAMNRAHRIGQSKRLLVYRLVVRASVEERILQLAKKKLMLDHLFANKSGSQKEVEDILRWGTEELFQDCSGQGDAASNIPRMEVVMEGSDDGDGKQRKRVGGLGDVYEDTCHKSGRSKILWDDAAVARLLDRSDLTTEMIDGEAESDMLGSLKAWDWNEQDVTEEQETSDCFIKEKDAGSPTDQKISGTGLEGVEEENNWDKFLRRRWEKLQIEEEAALGRGKRMRKTVSYKENFNSTAAEVSNESGNDDEEDPEPEYTPAGRALKNKLAKLRARQKERIASRSKELQGTFEAFERDKVACAGGIEGGENQNRPDLCPSTKSWSGQASTAQGSDFLYSNNPSRVSACAALVSSALPVTSMNLKDQDQHNSYQAAVSSDPGLPVSNSLPNCLSSDLTSSGQGWKHFFAALPQSFGRVQLPGPQQFASQNGSLKGSFTCPLNDSPFDLGLRSFPSQRLTTSDCGQSHNPANITSESCRLPVLQKQFTIDKMTGSESLGSAVRERTSPNQMVLPASLLQSRDGHALESSGPSRVQLPLLSAGEEVPSCSVQPSIHQNLAPNLTMSLGLGVSCAASLDISTASKPFRNEGIARKHPTMSTTGTAPANFTQTPEISKDFHGSASGNTAGYESDFSSRLKILGSGNSQPRDDNQAKNYQTLTFLSGVGGARSTHTLEDSTTWTEEELDALWSGVRRHGRGNWAAMLQDPRLCFSKIRTAKDLADRWNDEQLKMFGGPFDWSDNSIRREGSRAMFRRSLNDGSQVPFVQRERSFGTGRTKSNVATTGPSHTREMLPPKTDLESLTFRGSLDEKLSLFGPPQMGSEQVRGRLTHMGTASTAMVATSREEEVARVDLGRKSDSHRSPTQGLSTPAVPPSKQGDDFFTSHRYLDRLGTVALSNTPCTPFQFNKSFSDPLTGSLPRCTVGEGEWNFSSLQLRFGKGTTSSHLETVEFPKLQNFPDKLPQRLQELQSFTTSLNFTSSDVPMKVPENRETVLPQYVGPSDLRGLLQSVSSNLSLDKKKLKAGQSVVPSPSMTAESVSGKSSFTSNLPHWLREAFKAPAPPQPALPSNIAAVAQAIDLVYRDSKSLLPAWINPGPPPVPPHRKSKKKRKKKKGPRLGCRVIGDGRASTRDHLGNIMLPNLSMMGKQNQSCYSAPGLTLLDRSFPSVDGRLSSTLLNVPSCTSSLQWALGQGVERQENSNLPLPSDMSAQISNTGKQLLLASAAFDNLHTSTLKPPLLCFDQFVSSGLALGSLASQGSKSMNPLDQGHLQQHWQPFISGNRDYVKGGPQPKLWQPELSQQMPSALLASSNDIVNRKLGSNSTDSEDSSSKTHSDPCIRVNGREASNNEDASSEQTISDDRSSRH